MRSRPIPGAAEIDRHLEFTFFRRTGGRRRPSRWTHLISLDRRYQRLACAIFPAPRLMKRMLDIPVNGFCWSRTLAGPWHGEKFRRSCPERSGLRCVMEAAFRVNITAAAKPGSNRLVVRVTNLWPNRLIGDEQLPPDCQWTGDRLKAGRNGYLRVNPVHWALHIRNMASLFPKIVVAGIRPARPGNNEDCGNCSCQMKRRGQQTLHVSCQSELQSRHL